MRSTSTLIAIAALLSFGSASPAKRDVPEFHPDLVAHAPTSANSQKLEAWSSSSSSPSWTPIGPSSGGWSLPVGQFVRYRVSGHPDSVVQLTRTDDGAFGPWSWTTPSDSDSTIPFFKVHVSTAIESQYSAVSGDSNTSSDKVSFGAPRPLPITSHTLKVVNANCVVNGSVNLHFSGLITKTDGSTSKQSWTYSNTLTIPSKGVKSVKLTIAEVPEYSAELNFDSSYKSFFTAQYGPGAAPAVSAHMDTLVDFCSPY